MKFLLALFGCTGGAGATRAAQLPVTFTPTVVVSAEAPIFLGFEGGPFAPIEQRRLAAWRIDGAQAMAMGPEGPGWYQAAAQVGGEVWAVAATLLPSGSGATYRLVVGGAAGWEDRGPIPASSIGHVATDGRGGGWVVGVGQLFRTRDGGASWVGVTGAPAPGNVAETLGMPGPDELIVGGGALLRTEDGGATWRALLAQPVLATDGTWVVSGTAERLVVSRRSGDNLTQTAEIEGGWQPDAVFGAGEVVRIRATKSGSVFVLESTDGGRIFAPVRARGLSDPHWVGLGTAVWSIDVERVVRKR
ncbi:hypothetical protein LBMAG42_30630 [Deltaproteobacteria bacterium]|nr:hypothetical protein LBMAG42_30630 [Deltaproteobacteria bacterium]